MKENKVWLITGAGSGIGLKIAKAALAAGNRVVATGKNASKVTKAIGNTTDSLLVVKMDVTNAKEISAGVNSAIKKFGTIDVLVNNAGNWYAGFFNYAEQFWGYDDATNKLSPAWTTRMSHFANLLGLCNQYGGYLIVSW